MIVMKHANNITIKKLKETVTEIVMDATDKILEGMDKVKPTFTPKTNMTLSQPKD